MAGFMALQAAAMWFAPDMALIGRVFGAYAAVPPAITLSLGKAAGAATVWLGWAGRRVSRSAEARLSPPERPYNLSSISPSISASGRGP
jgi:hypothetical protein